MRLPDWPDRLAHWILDRAGAPFEWGTLDCTLACIEAVDAIRGTREVLNYRGLYRNAKQAMRVQRRTGMTLENQLERLGVFRWQGAPLFGDLVIHPDPRWPFSCGHVVGRNGYVVSAFPDLGFAAGKLADAMAQPGATVWRIT